MNIGRQILLLSFLIFWVIGCGNVLLEDNYNYYQPGQATGTGGNYLENDLPVSLKISPPIGVSASQGAFADKIEISWNQVLYNGKSVSYHVYRRSDSQAPFVRITGYTPIRNLYLEDRIATTSNNRFEYAVRAISVEDGFASTYSNVVTGFLLSSAQNIRAGFRESSEYVEITWDTVEGAKFYILRRAEERLNGVVPALSDFQVVNSALTSTSFFDYSETFDGELRSNTSYYYYVTAHYSTDVASPQSGYARGSLLSLGAPAAPEVVRVSKGWFNNAIRIEFKSTSATNILYRISEEQYQAGDEIGTQVALDANFLTGNYFYDTSVDITSGESFYYRMASVNNFGESPLSDFFNPNPKSKFAGNTIGDYSLVDINVKVSREGFKVTWPICQGAPSYYLYRSLLDPSVEGFDDLNWVFAGAPTEIPDDATSLTYIDKPDGVNIELDTVWYKVIPINADIYTDKVDLTLPNPVAYPQDSNGLDVAALELEMASLDGIKDADNETGFEILWGKSNFSNYNSDFTVPVPEISGLAASQNGAKVSGAKQNSVRVAGKIELSDPTYLEKLNVKIIRTSSYGKEKGVYPLSEPNFNGDVSYSKEGVAFPTNQIVYDISDLITSDGTFTWDDPMVVFDENGKIEEGMAHKWNYAAWDREGWKHVKRKLRFNMNTSVKIHYKILVERANDPEWDPKQSASFEGWPELGDLEFAHLAEWLREIAFNRLWKVQIPRWNWDNTVSVLLGGVNQSANGQNSGKISLSGNTSSGSGSMDNYSDWPGIVATSADNTGAKKAMTLAIDIGSQQDPQNIDFWVSITTPLYNGTLHGVNCKVRDFGWQWGIYPTSSEGKLRPGNEGTVEIWYNGRHSDLGSSKNVFPSGVLAENGNASYGVHFESPYGYDEFDYTGLDFVPAPFTRFSYKYRPQPENNGPWSSNAKSNWVMNYEYIN